MDLNKYYEEFLNEDEKFIIDANIILISTQKTALFCADNMHYLKTKYPIEIETEGKSEQKEFLRLKVLREKNEKIMDDLLDRVYSKFKDCLNE